MCLHVHSVQWNAGMLMGNTDTLHPNSCLEYNFCYYTYVCFPMCLVTHVQVSASDGSRGGTMGSMEPPFGFLNYIHKQNNNVPMYNDALQERICCTHPSMFNPSRHPDLERNSPFENFRSVPASRFPKWIESSKERVLCSCKQHTKKWSFI